MKKVFVSTMLTIGFLWMITIGMVSSMKFNEQVKYHVSTGVDEVNVSLFYLSIGCMVIAGVGMLLYLRKRWKEEKQKRNITFLAFLSTDINSSEEDEREKEIGRRASLSSGKFMDFSIFLGIILLQHFKITNISTIMLMVMAISILTMRELFYLWKWYRYYNMQEL